ncbi:MAG: DNA-3-methyladenine glycosylase [Candidatus Aenigmarchaeota archaeon]|nr:DNA-3-methyladenine glycosylase [Candidatus Aenigmarchaeota archaeon]
MSKLSRDFFSRGPEQVAYELVGRRLVRDYGDRQASGVVVETAAFRGIGGTTRNREGIQYEPGKIYVMPFRGKYFFNVTTAQTGEPTCVWVRELYAAEGVERTDVNGPAKLSKALGIGMDMDGKPVDGDELWFEGEGVPASQVAEVPREKADNCVGIYRLKL